MELDISRAEFHRNVIDADIEIHKKAGKRYTQYLAWGQ